ncbi:uncharacterized protein LOC119745819 [Patiria miniata]|uniref:Uncharacterized protein n=1 Tax=Patiria miniata TaxID=46514 RepID=A0A914BRX2_PATMI|nr:uncharacterized protein LOC119745819 [Patiria miniata]
MASEIQSQALQVSQDGPSHIQMLPSEVWLQGQDYGTDFPERHAGLETEQIQLRYPSPMRWQTDALPGDTEDTGLGDSVSAGGMCQRPYPVLLIRANPVSDSDDELETPSLMPSSDILQNQDVVEEAGHISPSSGSASPGNLAVYINCKPALLSSLKDPTLETTSETERQQAESNTLSVQHTEALSTLEFSSHLQGHSASPNQSIAYPTYQYLMTNEPLTMPPISPETCDDLSTTSPQASRQTIAGIFQDTLQSLRARSASAEMASVAESHPFTFLRDSISNKSEMGFPRTASMGFSSEPTLSNKRTIYDINDNLLPSSESHISKQFCSETREAVDRHQHNYVQSMKLPRSEPQLSPSPNHHLNFQTRNATQRIGSCHPQEIQFQMCNSISLANKFKLPSPENANTPTYSSGIHARAVSTEKMPRSPIPYFSNVAYGGTSTVVPSLKHLTNHHPHSCVSSLPRPKSLDAQRFPYLTSEIPTPFCLPSPSSRVPGALPARETLQMSPLHHTPNEHVSVGAVQSPGLATDVPSPIAVFPFDATPVPWPSLPPVNSKGSAIGSAAARAPAMVSPLHEPANLPTQPFQPSLPYLARVPNAAPDHVPFTNHWSPIDILGADKPVAPSSRPQFRFFPVSGHMDHSFCPPPAVSLPSMTSVAMPVSSSPMHWPPATPSPTGTFQKCVPSFQSSTVQWLSVPTSKAWRPANISRSSHLPSFGNFSLQSPEMMPQTSSVGPAGLSYTDLFRNGDTLQPSTPYQRKPPPPYPGERPTQPVQDSYPYTESLKKYQIPTQKLSPVNEPVHPYLLKELLVNPPLVNPFQHPAMNTYPHVHCSSKYTPGAATQENVPPEHVSKRSRSKARRQNKALKKRAASKTSSSQQSTSSDTMGSWVSKFIQTSFDFLRETSLQNPTPTLCSEKCLPASHQGEEVRLASQPGATSKEGDGLPKASPVVQTAELPSTVPESARSFPLPHRQEVPLRSFQQNLSFEVKEPQTKPANEFLKVFLAWRANIRKCSEQTKDNTISTTAEVDASTVPFSDSVQSLHNSHGNDSSSNEVSQAPTKELTGHGLCDSVESLPQSDQSFKPASTQDAMPASLGEVTAHGLSHSTESLLHVHVDPKSKASTTTHEDLNAGQRSQYMGPFQEHSSPGRAANKVPDESPLRELIGQGSSNCAENLQQINPSSNASTESLQKVDQRSNASTEIQGVANQAQTLHMMQPSEEHLSPLGRAAEEKVLGNIFRCINCNQVTAYIRINQLTRCDTEVLAKLNLFIGEKPEKMSGLLMCESCLNSLRLIGLDQQKLERARADFRREICKDTFLMTWVSHSLRKNYCVHCGCTLLPHPHRTDIFRETSDGWVPADVIISELSVLSPMRDRHELYLCMPCFRDLASIREALTLMKIDMAKFLEKMSQESVMYFYCCKKVVKIS